jgi:hypothetical protein
MRDLAAFGDYRVVERDPDEAVGSTEMPPPHDAGDVDDMGVLSEIVDLDALFAPSEAADLDEVFR